MKISPCPHTVYMHIPQREYTGNKHTLRFFTYTFSVLLIVRTITTRQLAQVLTILICILGVPLLTSAKTLATLSEASCGFSQSLQ
jgi:hypothetical protein